MSTSVSQAESWAVHDPLIDASEPAVAPAAGARETGDQRRIESPVDSRLHSRVPTGHTVEPRSQASAAGAQGSAGRITVVLSSVAAAGCAAADLGLTHGRLTFFFDLCFVVLCLVAAMAVRSSDLFTVGVLPPLLFAAVIAVVAVTAPAAFEPATGVAEVFLTGLATHAFGLVAGYTVALLTVAARTAAARS
ncbi:MAG: DUF6542 domain-containing protein [Nocardioidaceae bacterium]